ncbi:FecR family protein [Salegentibacter holothuriorum]|uniref:FecR family protein n=1 Tax=Salegentibacter holothuriorum TaxID=241145 RepID=A0A1T5CSI5_9FLAO|nr:FecR family protein [Salegentibacter holothuriorum]SKB62445.1 FecR family protein [Salegentibacter holothuriorum]
MNRKDHIKGLLLKFSRNRCSEDEIKQIVSYFRNNPNEQALPEAQEALQHIILEDNGQRKSENEVYAEIKNKIQYKKSLNINDKNKNQKLWLTSIAAIFITILSSSLFLYLTKPKQVEQVSVAKDSIILEREDGTVKALSEQGEFQLKKRDGQVIGGQKGNLLIYRKCQQASTKTEYNILRVPNGKRFKIQLSDGSIVFMNAGSSLKYPVNFPKKDNRQVFLTGEAFFKIAKDENRPFKVIAQNLEIGVLGTEFNVSAYPEDMATNVVLVEGAVQLKTGQHPKAKAILKPGQLASSNRSTNNLEINEVDTSIYTAWMEGEMVFRNISFENILKKMERHFGVTIINKNTTIAKEKFNASFGEESLFNILEYFRKTYGLDYTQQSDRQIIINPKTNKMNQDLEKEN